MNSLWAITSELKQIDEILEQSGGELDENSEGLMVMLANQLATKTDNCVMYIEHEKAMVELAKSKMNQIKDYIKSKEAKIERFEDYIKSCLELSGQQSFRGELHEIKTRKPSQVLKIYDEKEVPLEYTKVETIISIDENALKKAVKEGSVTSDKIKLEDGKTSIIYTLKK